MGKENFEVVSPKYLIRVLSPPLLFTKVIRRLQNLKRGFMESFIYLHLDWSTDRTGIVDQYEVKVFFDSFELFVRLSCVLPFS